MELKRKVEGSYETERMEHGSETESESYDADVESQPEINYEFEAGDENESIEVETADVEIDWGGGVDAKAFEAENELSTEVAESGGVKMLESLDLSELEAELYDHDLGLDAEIGAELGDLGERGESYAEAEY